MKRLENSPPVDLRRFLPLLMIILVGVLGYFGYKRFSRGEGIPNLPDQELNSQGKAGVIEHLQGTALVKPAESKDFNSSAISSAAAEGVEGWIAPIAKDGFLPETLFHLKPNSSMRVMTAGNWLVAMDGEGEFIFEDGKVDAEKKAHSTIWTVKKGTFRAKPHDYDPSTHWIEVKTAAATVYCQQSEFGLRISEGGKGQVWLISGKIIVLWKDGRRKEITQKGMDYL